MISYDVALARILAEAAPLATERVSLAELATRVLAAPVFSAVDVPGTDNSAMDGYAVRTPVEGPLKVVGEIAAGDDPGWLRVGPGEAVRIFTGSALPPGADAVVMQERVTRSGDTVEVEGQLESGAYIRRKGEELTRGHELASAGRLVDPALLGLIAAAGVGGATVYRRPRVSVVETGAELIDAGQAATTSSVYAANGRALGAACEALGAEVRKFRSGDDPEELELVLRAAEDCDLLITSGGVSVGDHDLVKPMLRKLGVEELFWRVAIRPGKPVFFARRGNRLVLGLPGNPASSLVTFQLFARPALLVMQGLPVSDPVTATLATETDPAESVETFLRVQLRDGFAYPIAQQGSNMASSVALADALLRIPSGSEPVPVGTTLPAIPLVWGR